jgi:hypothetical protein
MLRFHISGKLYTTVGAGEEFRGKLVGKYFPGKEHNRNFSRSWHLRCCGLHLGVRYSCAAHNANEEVREIDDILKRIEEIDDAAA